MAQRLIARDRDLLVLDAAGVVAGYATFGRSRGSRIYQGEIYELYLAPVYQGIGLGEHLFEACRNRFDDRSLNGLMVWALAENDDAVDFYWRRGGRPVGRSQGTIRLAEAVQNRVRLEIALAALDRIERRWT